ncbi:hypothetical protein [Leporid alphaherpesvirus 4]|uniref:Uncharacterized protein n=1 Tax=Leporid alphaherpesvirus 4 TaxID=481315 RepID=J9QQT7_9ALPH|nr:hypothetical protein [Leporid alphaherpesvirus 4]AFR32501.1 hypothetical protein [Leporid alphaherpesvirus 4]
MPFYTITPSARLPTYSQSEEDPAARPPTYSQSEEDPAARPPTYSQSEEDPAARPPPSPVGDEDVPPPYDFDAISYEDSVIIDMPPEDRQPSPIRQHRNSLQIHHRRLTGPTGSRCPRCPRFLRYYCICVACITVGVVIYVFATTNHFPR